MFGNNNQAPLNMPPGQFNPQPNQPNVTRAQIIYPISQQGAFFSYLYLFFIFFFKCLPNVDLMINSPIFWHFSNFLMGFHDFSLKNSKKMSAFNYLCFSYNRLSDLSFDQSPGKFIKSHDSPEPERDFRSSDPNGPEDASEPACGASIPELPHDDEHIAADAADASATATRSAEY